MTLISVSMNYICDAGVWNDKFNLVSEINAVETIVGITDRFQLEQIEMQVVKYM